MHDLLIILNPRRIVPAMRAFEDLEIDRLWIRNMTEYEIQERWGEVMELAKGYDTLIVASDDGIVRPHALEEVRRLHDQHPTVVVTGYSNLSAEDFRSNLTRCPTAAQPAEDAYDLYTVKEIMESDLRMVRSYFTGMCLTTMSYELWERYPFRVWAGPPGNASDFVLSQRLVSDDVQIWAARDAFVWHVKEVWNRPDRDDSKRLYLEEPSELVLDRR